MNIPLNIDFQQVLLHLMNFLILAAGLTFLLFRPVKKFMNDREKQYSDREKAVSDREKIAASAEAEYAARLEAADAEIRDKRSAEAKRLEAEYAARMEETTAKADRIIEDAKKEAEAQRDKILRSTKREIAGLVVEAAERLMAKDHDPETDKALYDQFISDMGKDADNDDQ